MLNDTSLISVAFLPKEGRATIKFGDIYMELILDKIQKFGKFVQISSASGGPLDP